MLPATMVCRINGWSSTRNDFNNLWHTSGKKRSPKQTYAAYVAAWINSARPGLWKCIYWHGNVFILMTFSSLATLVAVRLTGSSAANDGNLLQDRRWNADKPSAALDPYIPTWLTTSPANHRPANFWIFFLNIGRKLWKVVQSQVELMKTNLKFEAPILWFFKYK